MIYRPTKCAVCGFEWATARLAAECARLQWHPRLRGEESRLDRTENRAARYTREDGTSK